MRQIKFQLSFLDIPLHPFAGNYPHKLLSFPSLFHHFSLLPFRPY